MDTNHITMKELPTSERPYERCLKYGAGVLTDAELIAVLLKNGTKKETALQLASRMLLSVPKGTEPLAGLMAFKQPDFMGIPGIGPVKTATMLCAMELAKRLSMAKYRPKLAYNDPQTVADYYMEVMRFYDREHFLLLLLDSKNALIREVEISVGTVNASFASPREVMIEALQYKAVHIILIHNHPSGNPVPSPADIEVTKKIQAAGRLMDIYLLDHIIIGEQDYVSMRASHLLS